MKELSGTLWCARFPGSNQTSALTSQFRVGVEAFIAALKDAGATVNVAATFRPPERAYLMHYAWSIAEENMTPADVPALGGVDIDWVHRDEAGAADAAKSKQAAHDMVNGYGMDHKAALISRHTARRAIDMTIAWSASLHIRDANGGLHNIISEPRTGMNLDLHQVGATNGVIKLISDRPHWSDDGH